MSDACTELLELSPSSIFRSLQLQYLALQSGSSGLSSRCCWSLKCLFALVVNILFWFDFILFFTTVLFHWDFSYGKFGLLFLGKASCDRVVLPKPTVHAECFSVSIIHRPLTWTAGSLTCTEMLMNAIAHRGVGTRVRESPPKDDSGRETPCGTGESNLRPRHAGPTLYQLKHDSSDMVWTFSNIALTYFSEQRFSKPFHCLL